MKSSTGLLVFAGLWVGSLGIFGFVVGLHYLVRGELPSAFVAFGATVFCAGFVIPTFKVAPGRVLPRIESDSTGTMFRPDRGVEIPMQVAMAGALVSCALILILLPAGRLAIPVPPNMRWALPFTAAVMVVAIPPMLWRNIKRGSASYLRLTDRGFEFAQGWQPRSADWTSVRDIASEVPDQKAQTPGAIVFVLDDGTTMSFTATAYTPGGGALRELVHYYWEHPDSRGELTDNRVRDRLMTALRTS
jgi:hypothetical protein